MAIFAPDERLPSSATLTFRKAYSLNFILKYYQNHNGPVILRFWSESQVVIWWLIELFWTAKKMLPI